MVRFFETLKDFNSYDEEVFPCELVVSIDTVTQNLFRRCSHGFFFFFFFYETVFNPSHSSTARLESVGGAGHRWEGNSPTHTEEFSGRHDGIPSDPTYNYHF